MTIFKVTKMIEFHTFSNAEKVKKAMNDLIFELRKDLGYYATVKVKRINKTYWELKIFYHIEDEEEVDRMIGYVFFEQLKGE